MTTPSSTIYVGNIPSHLDESSLSAHFAPFGDIVSVSVPSTTTAAGRRNKGFAFITFSSQDDALDALDNMNLNAIAGRTIQVRIADPTKAKEAASGARPGGRAVWDDEEWLKRYAVEQGDAATHVPATEQPTT